MALSVDSAKWLTEVVVKGLQQVADVLSFIGIFYVGKVTLTVVWDLTSALRVHVWSKLVSRDLAREYGGKWAVVTGASDGIGKGYAAALAKKGMNVMLISRTQEKLEKVAQDIRGQYGVETEIMQVDFALGRPIYEDIGKHLAGKEIGILVNNVGVIGSGPCFFEDMVDDDLWALINVNTASVPAMTKLVLPGMLARKKGAIINISSIGGQMSVPLLQVYCATKSFVNRFSEVLDFEYRSSGITVQNIIPSAVSTNMTRFDPLIHTEGLLTPNPNTFAAHALSTLGYARYTTGYWTHGIQSWLYEKAPSSLLAYAYMWRFMAVSTLKKSN
ncbi:inactive hydroxysteroid dehydrogenase-like protein 1 [Procambarus clarkii]|uniref:inactive hydroxysteroid dehydrogenase-like protein 1 n=1 Tax=Procambarus clarkii TaxID=6728 RepID=UPI001E678CFD|nr:inactive hydroxysteroid dehydrogenase-like protein 1 [Procambarus clarkii]